MIGYDGAEANYNIRIRSSIWHEVDDCDSVFSDDSESGPCNRIMQFPAAIEKSQGYLVSHEQHYSNLRREVAYLVQSASAEVMDVAAVEQHGHHLCLNCFNENHTNYHGLGVVSFGRTC